MYKKLLAMVLVAGVTFGITGSAFVDAKDTTVLQTCALGDGLTHDSRFDNCEKVYGVDVSKWQGNVDWQKVKAAGIDFAILRVAYRSSGSGGTLMTDPYFDANMKGAREAGIDLGVYFYTQAITEEEAEAEALYTIDLLKKYPGYLTYPVYYDIENTSTDRMGKAKPALTRDDKTAFCQVFCDTILEAGYQAGVYTNYHYFNQQLYKEDLEDYEMWLARYANSPTVNGVFYEGKYNMWQYSSTGKVAGITGNADMDVFYRDGDLGKVTGLKQSDVSDSSISISWDAVKYAEGYQLVLLDEEGNKLQSFMSTENTYQWNELPKGEKLRIKVRAYYINSNGEYKYGSYSSILDAYTKLNKVEGVVEVSKDSSTVTITWDKLPNAQGYQVRLYDPVTKKYTSVGFTKENTYVVPDLVVGNEYQVCVRGYAKVNGSTKTYGATSAKCKVSSQLQKVVNITATDVTASSATFAWTGQENVDGYEINCYDSDKVLLSTEVCNTEVWTKQELESCKNYMFEVRAFVDRADGVRVYGDYSDIFSIVTPLGQVTGVKSESVKKTSFKLLWEPVPNAKKYRIYMYSEKTGKNKCLGTTTKTKYLVKSLKANTTYKMRVRACIDENDVASYGKMSKTLKVKTSK